MTAEQGAVLGRSDVQVAAGEASGRIDYMDNLRALAMLLGVLFHAGLSYGEDWRELWLVRDNASTEVLDVPLFLSHLFRMALFFLPSSMPPARPDRLVV